MAKTTRNKEACSSMQSKHDSNMFVLLRPPIWFIFMSTIFLLAGTVAQNVNLSEKYALYFYGCSVLGYAATLATGYLSVMRLIEYDRIRSEFERIDLKSILHPKATALLKYFAGTRSQRNVYALAISAIATPPSEPRAWIDSALEVRKQRLPMLKRFSTAWFKALISPAKIL